MVPLLSIDPHYDGIEDHDEDVQQLAVGHGYSPDLSNREKDEILDTAEIEAEELRAPSSFRPVWPQ
jgi:hypothetical protein